MVNRILIRIKVVQLLYAYLLTRTEFRIDTDPDMSSADKKFAYSAYIDLLLLLLELTGHRTTKTDKARNIKPDRRLATSTVGNALADDLTIKDIIFKEKHNAALFRDSLDLFLNEIYQTAIYRENKNKRKFGLEEEVNMWIVLFESTLLKSGTLKGIMRNMPGYTSVGFEMAVERVVETLKSFYGTRAGYWQALQNLEASLLQAHKLYISLFELIVQLTHEAENQIENAKTKFLATSQDKNPNTRFIDNEFAVSLSANRELTDYVKEYGIGWTGDITLLSSLLNLIKSSQIYKDYMEDSDHTWEKDCEFWRQILKNVILPSDELFAALEDTSVYWNDDMHIIGTFVLKSIRIASLASPGTVTFLPRYKDEEDSRFGAELFEYAVKNRGEYSALVDRFVDTSNWDAERIAFMDSIIMICAIAEIVNFPNIPLAVSLNEYIDIANTYSSAKSGHFINGILSSVVQYLRQENIIMK